MMKLTIKNNSEKHIIVKLNQGESLRIDGLGQYIYESDILSDSVNFMVENNFESYMNDDKYYLSISACAECSTSINEEGIIYINRKNGFYQNTVCYEYFTISTNGCNLDNLSHTVTNSDEMIRVYNQRIESKKSGKPFKMLLNLIDTLSLGGIMGVILWIVFDYKVMLLFLLGLYLFITVVNLCINRLHRSKIRFLNWAKDDFDEDDIPYFVEKVNIFCK